LLWSRARGNALSKRKWRERTKKRRRVRIYKERGLCATQRARKRRRKSVKEKCPKFRRSGRDIKVGSSSGKRKKGGSFVGERFIAW